MWECRCYIAMDAMRAGIVDGPAECRFGSLSEWCGTGRHPLAGSLRGVAVPREPGDPQDLAGNGVVTPARRRWGLSGGVRYAREDADAPEEAVVAPPLHHSTTEH